MRAMHPDTTALFTTAPASLCWRVGFYFFVN
jgi:hypothetical protein